MSDEPTRGSGVDERHEAARHMAEAAMRAEAAGDTAQAESLLEQADKIDPDAVVEVVAEHSGHPIPPAAEDDGAEARDARLKMRGQGPHMPSHQARDDDERDGGSGTA